MDPGRRDDRFISVEMLGSILIVTELIGEMEEVTESRNRDSDLSFSVDEEHAGII
jgi:hypothetical protein